MRMAVMAGTLLATTAAIQAATRYVWQESPSPGPPYDTWANAAHEIQTAVDAAQTGDEIVVTNGVYATGGRAVGTNVLANRVAMDRPLVVRSVNGPEVTIIQGYQVPDTTNGDGAVRCVYLAEGASLSGFTLTNGATRTTYDGPTYHESGGGGVWCESTNVVVSDCVLTGNSAYYRGGGAYGGTLNNCTLTGNSDGGAYGCTLNNCTLSGNSGYYGGGAEQCTLNNCMLASNSAEYGGGGAYGGTLNNCTLTGNSAEYGGGGAYEATLHNCTLTHNRASQGGGACGGTLNNCIIYFNTATQGAELLHGLDAVARHCHAAELLLHHADADQRRRQHHGRSPTGQRFALERHFPLSRSGPCRLCNRHRY